MAEMKRRNLFEELKQGLDDVKQHRAGKITLREYDITEPSLPEVTPDMIRETRERLHLSRAVFAHELHVSPRTLVKWEQGRVKPNDQAATLILLVRKYPDTLKRLKSLSAKAA